MSELVDITRTVYSLIYPEANDVVRQTILAYDDRDYRDVWTQRQDDMHLPLLDAWKDHVSPVFDRDCAQSLGLYNHGYVTQGSSEAIRERIAKFATDTRDGAIHVMSGEYEGYKAYAEGYGLTVVEHPREDVFGSINRYVERRESIVQSTFDDLFFISQPSAIDGNIWAGYKHFVLWLQQEHPHFKIALDLCYVGATEHSAYNIPVTQNLDCVFFSLSKVFGVYYHRIGGCLSREPIQNLYGNKWFKNLLSIRIGEALLNAFKLSQLPYKYSIHQRNLIKDLVNSGHRNLSPSDVVMLASFTSKEETPYSRAPIAGIDDTRFRNRVCLTPIMQRIIGY